MNYVLKEKLEASSSKIPFKIYIKGDEFRVGRRTHNNLAGFPFLSREHAAFLTSDSSDLFLQDLKSSNGTFLNGVKLEKGLKKLKVGDTICFGGPDASNAVTCILCRECIKQEIIDLTDEDNEPVADSVPSSNVDVQTLVNVNKPLCKTELSENCIPNVSTAHTLDAIEITSSALSSVPSTSNSNCNYSNDINVSEQGSSFTNNSTNANLSLKKISTIEIKHSKNCTPKTINGLNLDKVEKFESYLSSTMQPSPLFSPSDSSNKVMSKQGVKFKGSSKNVTLAPKILSHERLPLFQKMKPCSVHLIKIDSELFEWPSDVQNPFKKQKLMDMFEDEPVVRKSRKKRRARMLSTDSSSDEELPPISIRENHVEEADKEVSYSQVEEVITISDDESYLDFNSSQNYIHIKQEPQDDDEDEDIYREIFGGSESFLGEPNISLDQGDNIESIDSIRKFVNASTEEVKTKRSEETYIEPAENNLDLDLECSDESNVSEYVEKEEMETLSSTRLSIADSVTENSSINKISQAKGKKIDGFNSSSRESKSIKKSVGIILFTEPQPMKQRPRKIRGREEGFTERQKCPKIPTVSTKKSAKLSPVKDKRKCSRGLSSHKPVVIATNDLKNNDLKNFKIPRKSKAQNHEKASDDKEVPSTSNFSNLNRSSSANNNVAKKITSTVKRRNDKFSCRSGFLTNQTEAELKKGKQITARTKGPSNIKAVKSSNEKEQNISCPISASTSQASLKCKDNKQIMNNNSQDINNKLRKEKQTAGQKEQPSTSKRDKDHVEKEFNSRLVPNSILQDTAKHREFQKQIKIIPAQRLNRTPVPLDPRLSRQISTQENFTSLKPLEGYDKCLSNSSSVAASSSRHIVSNHSEAGYLQLIKEILKMQPAWLEEQAKIKKPPEQVSKGATDLPVHFKSYDDYVSHIFPMIRLEIWEYMFAESKEVFKSKKCFNRFYFSVLSYISKNDCIELKCESIVNQKKSYSPREGTLVAMELTVDSKTCIPFFGYIFKHEIFNLDCKYVETSEWRKLPKDLVTDAKHWKFYVYIKKKELAFLLGCVLKGNGICYLRSKLRQLDALDDLKSSPLLDNILQPKLNSFTINYSRSSPTREYTSCQRGAIDGICDEIEKPSVESKIILVQGPPGTGKTHTLIGLLEQLVLEGKPKKILVVAPSNAAIDEIGCRLLDLNEQYSFTRNINIVRIGYEAQVNKKMLPYFLENKVKELHKQSIQKDYKLKEKEIERFAKEISRHENQLVNLSTNEKYRYLKEHHQYLVDHQSTDKKLDYKTEMSLKETILKECDVVLSTLNSTLNTRSQMRKIFKLNSKVHLSCCIMDESTQCTEVEVLQPLALGINKLILFGDHEQLPATVNSNLARQHGFERSMFERFNLFFERYHRCSPAFVLTEQFRMHSKICEFPSKHIYGERLHTDPQTDIRYRRFPLKPYLVLDILNSQETNQSSSKLNCAEASVIVNICKCLLEVIDTPFSIGIISFYSGQRSLYEDALHQNPHYRQIEINTVDGFQGREKEVIILSCVRAKSNSGGIGFVANRNRLNVAITRAKKCLIICCHINSMINDPDWRALLEDARDRKICFTSHSSKDIPIIFEKYMKKEQ